MRLIIFLFSFASCAGGGPERLPQEVTMNEMSSSKNVEIATLGAGCFWCVEAQFQMLNGVISVVSGYAGGKIKNPSYKEVCTGRTGHAEVCQIKFDPEVLPYSELLEAFWQVHDPTQLNRQGNDVGTQYRSVIFYHSESQKEIAERQKSTLNQEKAFPNPIVTEIAAFEQFYRAEDYHQDYFEMNGTEPYCQMVIKPKLDHFKEVFKNKLRK